MAKLQNHNWKKKKSWMVIFRLWFLYKFTGLHTWPSGWHMSVWLTIYEWTLELESSLYKSFQHFSSSRVTSENERQTNKFRSTTCSEKKLSSVILNCMSLKQLINELPDTLHRNWVFKIKYIVTGKVTIGHCLWEGNGPITVIAQAENLSLGLGVLQNLCNQTVYCKQQLFTASKQFNWESKFL